MSPSEAAPIFFLAVAVILLFVVRLVCMGRWSSSASHRSSGEMVAGVLLGPSLFGLLLPGVQAAVFPDGIKSCSTSVGQIGLVIYMFGAGYEFNLQEHPEVEEVGRGDVPRPGRLVPLVLGIGGSRVLGTSWVGIGKDGVSLGDVGRVRRGGDRDHGVPDDGADHHRARGWRDRRSSARWPWPAARSTTSSRGCCWRSCWGCTPGRLGPIALGARRRVAVRVCWCSSSGAGS